ncbi:uncharacterized protein TNCV_4036551 [Trichonephila clavipes]|nr:uncharacterized protein TNCV_4036551 [Trichonephila clavipes]
MKDAYYMLAVAWDSLEGQSLKNAWNKLWPDLDGEKDFNDDHREDITDFVQSILGFQECDEVVETWMACDAKDCGFQMLNDDEIVTFVQEQSGHVDNETTVQHESSTCPSNADAFFCVRDSYGVVRTTIRMLSYSTTAAQENQILQRKNEGYQSYSEK